MRGSFTKEIYIFVGLFCKRAPHTLFFKRDMACEAFQSSPPHMQWHYCADFLNYHTNRAFSRTRSEKIGSLHSRACENSLRAPHSTIHQLCVGLFYNRDLHKIGGRHSHACENSLRAPHSTIHQLCLWLFYKRDLHKIGSLHSDASENSLQALQSTVTNFL